MNSKIPTIKTPLLWQTAVLFSILGFIVIPPVFYLLQRSLLNSEGDYSLLHYYEIFNVSSLAIPFFNTLIFAVGSSIVALVMGGTNALIVERTNSPFRALGYLTVMFSFSIPYLLYTISWLLILGRSGPVNAFLMNCFGITDPPINIFSMGGMIFIEGLLWSPMVFLMIGAAFKAMDPSLEESARMSGASVWSTFTLITIRIVSPAVFALMMLVSIRAFESFEIPALVGMPKNIFMLTTKIYLSTKFVPPEYGQASAFGICLLTPVAIALVFYNKLTKKAYKFQTVTGKGFQPRLLDLGRWKYLTSFWLVVYFIVSCLLPLLMLIWASLVPYYRRPSMNMLGRLTLKNFEKAFSYPNLLQSIQNTLTLGLVSATAIMLLSFLAAYLIVRTKAPGRRVIDGLASAPLVFPGIVLGLAVMIFYLKAPIPIYGTIWILAIAYTTRYLPYGMRYCSAGFLQIHSEIEEAASVSGASTFSVIRRILFPIMKPAFWAGWIFIFMLSMKELSISVLLSGPNSPVVAVSIFNLYENGQVTELSAFGLVWAFLLGIISIFFYKLSRQFRIG